MTALHDFIRASASYFGLPLDQLTVGSTLDTSNGDMEVVLRIALSPADVEGIAKRMAHVQVEQAQEGPEPARSDAQLRSEYQSLSRSEKSRYGSFARFKMCARSGGIVEPEPEPVTIPEVVWLERGEASEMQKTMAIGIDTAGNYGVAPEDLTLGQRAARGMDV